MVFKLFKKSGAVQAAPASDMESQVPSNKKTPKIILPAEPSLSMMEDFMVYVTEKCAEAGISDSDIIRSYKQQARQALKQAVAEHEAAKAAAKAKEK